MGDVAVEETAKRAPVLPMAAARFAIGLSVYAAILFIAAGTLAWPRGWLYMATNVTWILLNLAILIRVNPEVIRARSEHHEGTKGFDKVVVVLYTALTMGLLVVAGFDARFGWLQLPAWTVAPGILLFALASIPITWAMAVNKHLEPTVRIQEDRGHKVITDGPYRLVRHPMYVGILVNMAGSVLILGSASAFAVWAAMIPVMVARTALEDRTLRRELPGYEEFTSRTRFRLIPGVW